MKLRRPLAPPPHPLFWPPFAGAPAPYVETAACPKMGRDADTLRLVARFVFVGLFVPAFHGLQCWFELGAGQ